MTVVSPRNTDLFSSRTLELRKGNGVTSRSKAWHLIVNQSHGFYCHGLCELLPLPTVEEDDDNPPPRITSKYLKQYILIDTSRLDHTSY